MIKERQAFTLAEVLITLAIIGVVAILTIPNVIANYQNKVLTTQLKKAYNEISSAGALAISMEEAGTFKDTSAYTNRDFLTKYFKKTKDCGDANTVVENCFTQVYKNSNNEITDLANEFAIDFGSGDMHCIVAKTGYLFCLDYHNSFGFLDINGAKAPNKIGKDAFELFMANDGSVDARYSIDLENVMNNDWEIE